MTSISLQISAYTSRSPLSFWTVDNYFIPRLYANKTDSHELVNVFQPIISQVVELVAAQVNEVKRQYRKHPKVRNDT